MNTAKIYHDSEGNECTIYQAVMREPEWAASRIQVGEVAIKRVQILEDALSEIAKYPSTPKDELGYAGCRSVAKSVLGT